MKASREQRRRIVARILFDVSRYPRWLEVLSHWKLSLPSLPAPAGVRFGGGGPESEAHLRLKSFVANHPELVDLPDAAGPGSIEECLPSGDEIDVLFSFRGREIGVEVKARDASDAEIQRGLYQCVKYDALLKARQRATHQRIDVLAVLALGRTLPTSLRALRNVLGVCVIEEVG